MPISEARRKANDKYNARAYEEIKIRVSKGRKPLIQAAAEQQGESLNAFAVKAIDERIARLVAIGIG